MTFSHWDPRQCQSGVSPPGVIPTVRGQVPDECLGAQVSARLFAWPVQRLTCGVSHDAVRDWLA